MITTSSFSELMQAKNAIEELKMEKPDVYKKFAHIIHLTYQLQFKFQYMGSLIMDEDSTKHCPKVQDDYVLNVYQTEIKKLKADSEVLNLKQLLAEYKQLGYAKLSDLVMGKNPEVLVGPAIER
ncbi:MAG TPA: hypothetical protein VK097_03085 [Lentibacillus sp.]|uniref:hypothetical protein n=1 Tax=Lentibacillus sp. TaxID=1925746 RepID=UPI002B4AB190|nr:hypothetical protein [Lentibacillus sp.]HLR61404.1 hypothetical protein [Lentibacillus sp.]